MGGERGVTCFCMHIGVFLPHGVWMGARSTLVTKESWDSGRACLYLSVPFCTFLAFVLLSNTKSFSLA